jgi:putative oxidoreductase
MKTTIHMSRTTTVLLWVAQVVAAALSLMTGASKLRGAESMVALFDAIGIGQWFRYLTGAIEVVSAVLLPSLAFFGALALACTMVGAILTNLFITGGTPGLPIVLLATTTAIAWARRRA